MRWPCGEACRLVRELIADTAARLLVAIETGPDEAVLVGTDDAYLKLALSALQFVADVRTGQALRQLVGGVEVAGTAAFGAVFAAGEVSVSAGWRAASEEEVGAVAGYIRRLSPPSP